MYLLYQVFTFQAGEHSPMGVLRSPWAVCVTPRVWWSCQRLTRCYARPAETLLRQSYNLMQENLTRTAKFHKRRSLFPSIYVWCLILRSLWYRPTEVSPLFPILSYPSILQLLFIPLCTFAFSHIYIFIFFTNSSFFVLPSWPNYLNISCRWFHHSLHTTLLAHLAYTFPLLSPFNLSLYTTCSSQLTHFLSILLLTAVPYSMSKFLIHTSVLAGKYSSLSLSLPSWTPLPLLIILESVFIAVFHKYT